MGSHRNKPLQAAWKECGEDTLLIPSLLKERLHIGKQNPAHKTCGIKFGCAGSA